jgi:hypothetical protein
MMRSEPGWGRLLALMGAVSIGVYLYLALFVPGTLQYSPFTIQDDARQFHAWMPRLADPGALPGDVIADYWQSVSPPVYQLPFRAAAMLGIDPLLFGRLLPAALLVLTLWAGWRLALKVARDRRAAFFAAAFLFAYLVHEDSIFTATPRAFSAPLLLVALNATQARRPWRAAAWLALLAAIYPTTSIAGFGILGLAQLRRGERLPLVLPWRSIPPLAVGAAAIVLAALPLQQGTDRWSPVITLDQAMELPNMNRPEGRSSIVGEDGRIAWVCSSRMGFLPEAVPCGWGIPGAMPINALLLLPLILLALRSARGLPDPQAAERNRLYLHALVACSVCFAVAALFAFELHFSGRYTQRVLGPLEWMAIGQMIGTWLGARSRAWNGGVLALLAVLAATPLPGFVRPTDARLLQAVRQLPPDTRIAGVSEQLDVVPALTGRAITAGTEHAIPWHMGYYLPFARDLRRSLEAVTTHDPAQLATALLTSRADYLLVDRELLVNATIPERYEQVDPEAVARARQALAAGPSIVQRSAGRCAVYRGTADWLIGVPCLLSGAGAPPDDRDR